MPLSALRFLAGLAPFAPLALCYWVFPAVMGASHALRLGVPRNFIDGAWLGLALCCVVALALRPADKDSAPGRWMLGGSLLGLAALVRFAPALWAGHVFAYPLLMETKPVFYAAVAGLAWLAGFRPGARQFVLCGYGLAALLLAEFVCASVWLGAPARPYGSEEVNYDAALVLISFCLGLGGAASRRGLLCLGLGLGVSFSRTGLAGLAAVLALLAIRRRSVGAAAAGILALAGIGVSFAVRGLPADALADLDRYWMWRYGVELLTSHPWQALAGFTPGVPLPLAPPPALAALWASQGHTWNAPGVFAFNLHAFWLRLAVTWGVPAAAALATALAAWSWPTGQNIKRQEARLALAVALGVLGCAMGLLYLSNVAVPLLLALAVPAGLDVACYAAKQPQALSRADTR